MRIVAITLGALAVAGSAALGFGYANERMVTCDPGFEKVIVRDAGSCLGDYKKRVANEPIAFCTVTRAKCVPAAAKAAAEADKVPAEADKAAKP